MARTRKTLLIGYGNTLREDDAFGAIVSDLLKNNTKYDTYSPMQLTPELAEMIALYDRVYFIDANMENRAGVFAVPIAKSYDADNHALSPWALMKIAEKLYGSDPEWMIFSVGGESFGFSEKPTPLIEKAARELVEFLSRFS